MNLRNAVLVLTIGAFIIGAAHADSQSVPIKTDDVIAARQAGFSLLGAQFGLMKSAVAADADVKPFADSAKSAGLWARSIPSLFPKGTEQGHDTQAKPEIWSDSAGFEKAAQNMADAAAKLAQAAESGDKASFAAQFKETGKACGECHRAYRVRQPG